MAKIITKDTKPGKGIEKDAPEKRRFFLFFEIFFDKIFKLIQLNFIYFICLLPLFLGLYYSMSTDITFNTLKSALNMPPFYFRPEFPNVPGILLLTVSIFLTGPATAGFTYVLRNMQRREHTWVMSDFFSHFKKNFKQGIIMSIVDLVCYLLLYVALMFYWHIMPIDAPEVGTVLPFMGAVFVGALMLVFTWAHYYIYTMMVTFELEFSKLFKNSLIFAIGKFPLNLLITLIIVFVLYVVLWTTAISSIIAGVLLPVILLSLIGFITVFSTYPTIDKIMLQKQLEKTQGKRILNTRG